MKEISISLLLKNITETNNYVDDIWKTCLNEKGKRYKIKYITSSLKKLETLGFIKKIRISETDTYYNKVSYSNPDDYIGFVNNIMFGNESKIRKSLRNLENKRIFVDISKNLNSYKLGKHTKIDFEDLLPVTISGKAGAGFVQVEQLNKFTKNIDFGGVSKYLTTGKKLNAVTIAAVGNNSLITLMQKGKGKI